MKAKLIAIGWLLPPLFFAACSHHGPVGKRVFVAKGSISFVLPDSSLTYSKLSRWGPCCSSCSYDETNGFFHSRDSSIMVSVSVTAFPNSLQRTLRWQLIADEKQQRYVVSAKNRGLAVIECFKADSATRAVELEYRLSKSPEPGRYGQAKYAKSLVYYGPQRTLKLLFSGPDNAAFRQAVANSRRSVRIDSAYLQSAIQPYPQSQYLE